jgi:lipopolysaccharide transport system ATP-binding protein
MSSDIVIRAQGLGKKYTIGHQSAESVPTLRDAIMRGAGGLVRSAREMLRGQPIIAGDEMEEFWALKDVNFEVKRGEVLGIIGRNGAGKSTLLKVLSRITEPSEGRVEIKGRVASLLEVGTGFHPELSGRENVYLNGAILGMSRREIKAKFDEIVAFAEIERFLDTPVKRYSSGMYVRLAFAVAAHLEPEILVVDEVLAVGDAEFQKKCLGKMHDVAAGGRTVLFVSHNMAAIQRLCTSGLLLHQGGVIHRGPISDTVSHYMTSLEQVTGQSLSERKERKGDGRLKVTAVSLHDAQGEQIQTAICGQPLRLRLHYTSRFRGAAHAVDAAFNLRNHEGALLTCFANIQTGADRLELFPEGYLECHVPAVALRGGSYISTIFVGVDGVTCDWIEDAFRLETEDGDFFGTGKLVPRDHGEVMFAQNWSSAPTGVAA